MKKSVIFLCFFMGMSSLFMSCENGTEEDPFFEPVFQTSGDLIEYTTLSFIYNDKTYSSNCEVIGDSTIILDDSVRLIVESLALKPELASFIHKDGVIEYFEDFDLLKEKYGLGDNVQKGVMTKSSVDGARLQIFDDEDFKDRSFTFEGGIEIPQLKDSPYKFNDKMSSFQFGFTGLVFDGRPYYHERSYSVTFWEDDHYKNHSITYTIEAKQSWASFYNVPSLKRVPLYPGSSKNWNDKVTSLKFSMVR